MATLTLTDIMEDHVRHVRELEKLRAKVVYKASLTLPKKIFKNCQDPCEMVDLMALLAGEGENNPTPTNIMDMVPKER